MARPRRLELAGVPMHVVQRGVNRSACFFGDADRHFYLKCLGDASAKHGCAVHAYVLMGNHVHLLLTPATSGATARMLQDVGRKYVRVINTVHDRTGTLWEGRFKSSLIDTERYFLACHRYIELNPVRAGLVRHPAEYRWSSHHHYTQARRSALLTEHAIHLSFGDTPEQRASALRDILAVPLDDGTLEKIRSCANTECVLGSPEFAASASSLAGIPVRNPRRGRPPAHGCG